MGGLSEQVELKGEPIMRGGAVMRVMNNVIRIRREVPKSSRRDVRLCSTEKPSAQVFCRHSHANKRAKKR